MNINKEKINFFLPGPSYVKEEILREMMTGQIGHRSEGFKKMYLEILALLKNYFLLTNEALIFTTSSTCMMEVCFLNTKAENVLAIVNGAFSERWAQISKIYSNNVDCIEYNWGETIKAKDLKHKLASKKYSHILITHSETSTGALNPLKELIETINENSAALICVDAVSSLGGCEVPLNDIDFCFAGVQKALALPPGITICTVSEKFLKKANEYNPKTYYFDILQALEKAKDGYTNTTPSIPHFYAFYKQLNFLLEEGIENRLNRHKNLLLFTKNWAREKELEYFPEIASPTISCIKYKDSLALVNKLKEKNITIGSGYGKLKESTFRIGHMGEIQISDLESLLKNINNLL
ncbi:MAG: aminotransferase class V-fold PLP-dependent enzyme [Pseudomonadota bacterium]